MAVDVLWYYIEVTDDEGCGYVDLAASYMMLGKEWSKRASRRQRSAAVHLI